MEKSENFPDWIKHIELYSIIDGILYHDFLPASKKRRQEVVKQIVLPLSMQKIILNEYHDQPTAGHMAFLRTLLNIQKRYYWQNMVSTIKEYCKACATCQTTKKISYAVRPLLRPIDISKSPFDVVALDFMGPFKAKCRQGNAYIMVITCLFSKYD